MGNSIISRLEHRLYLQNKKRKLTNSNPTIIADNCVGGIISHDLGIRFNSPFVNIGFTGYNYIKLLSNLRHYLSLTPVLLNRELEYKGKCYPLVSLGDVEFIFAHEPDPKDAIKKWEERKKRIDYNNIFIIMSDAFFTSYEDIEEFDELPYKNKVVLSHITLPEIHSSYYIKGFEDKDELGVLTDWKPGFWKRRWLDDFDYVSFLNQKGD